MKNAIKVAATLSVAGVLALTGCGGDSDASDDGGTTLNLVGYSVLEQANKGVIKAFQDSDAGRTWTSRSPTAPPATSPAPSWRGPRPTRSTSPSSRT